MQLFKTLVTVNMIVTTKIGYASTFERTLDQLKSLSRGVMAVNKAVANGHVPGSERLLD